MRNSKSYSVVFLAVVAVVSCILVTLHAGKPVVGAEGAALDDSEATRLMLAGRCLECAPTEVVATMACGRVASLRDDIPTNRREEFIKAMMAELDLEKLAETRKKVMAKVFTAAELNALAEFYETPHGRAAWQKLSEYVLEMQAETRPRILEAEARARKTLGLPAAEN